MARNNRKKNIILAAVVAAVVLIMVLLPVLVKGEQKTVNENEVIRTAAVERGTIEKTVTGSGRLAGDEVKEITVPHGVRVTEYCIRNGEIVTEGQPLALVDRSSVMATIATVQENLDYLAKEMSLSRGGTTPTLVTAPTTGRVKAVYAQKGDEVRAVLEKYGALCVISLDGRMAVQCEAKSGIPAGEGVTVRMAGGVEYPGIIERRQEGILTVTLTDIGPKLGSVAEIVDGDGNIVGFGELYPHSALNITQIAGTVATVNAREEQVVGNGTNLFTLTNVESDGAYEGYAAEHRLYEATMLKLFELYENGAVVSTGTGVVSGVSTGSVGLMRNEGSSYSICLLADPNDTPHDAYPSRAAVISDVSFGKLVLQAASGWTTTTDFSASPTVNPEAAEVMTLTSGDFENFHVSVFGWNTESGAWQTIDPSELAVGDAIYLVSDGTEGNNPLWIVRPPVPEPEPEPEIEYSDPGGYVPEEPFEMFDRTETLLMKVTAQESVSVKLLVDEMDVSAVYAGQEAEVTLDALPGRVYTGTVKSIDPTGEKKSGSAKYTVTISLGREENMLDGMNANAILCVGSIEDVLWLPAEALYESGSDTVAYRGYDRKTDELTDPVAVKTGASNGAMVEILEGLEEGDTVSYRYYESKISALLLGTDSEKA